MSTTTRPQLSTSIQVLLISEGSCSGSCLRNIYPERRLIIPIQVFVCTIDTKVGAVTGNDPVHYLILMHCFPQSARVVVCKTYDRRDNGQQTLNCLYAFGASCRVVVCETYEHSDDVRFSHTLCKLFAITARVVVVNGSTRATFVNMDIRFVMHICKSA